MCQKEFYSTPAHVYQNYQCQIRLKVKLRFLVWLAGKIAVVNGIETFPGVRKPWDNWRRRPRAWKLSSLRWK